MSIQSEAQSLSPTARIDLFVLDLSQHNAGALYFCSTSNPFGGDVVWQGVTYTAMPISASFLSCLLGRERVAHGIANDSSGCAHLLV